MKFLCLAAFFITYASAFSLKAPRAPDVTFCSDGTGDWIGNLRVEVTPWPVRVESGASLKIDASFDLMKAVNDGSEVTLKLKLETPIGNIEIPCLEIDETTSVGSCTYTAARLLEFLKEQNMCDQFLPDGQTCMLPLNPGTYQGINDIVLEDIPPVLEPFLKGTVDATATVTDETGSEVMCLQLKLELE